MRTESHDMTHAINQSGSYTFPSNSFDIQVNKFITPSTRDTGKPDDAPLEFLPCVLSLWRIKYESKII